jgi:hypothetical protein
MMWGDELRALIGDGADSSASAGELRMVQSQITGWLAGLFQAFQILALERERGKGPSVSALTPPSEPRASGSYL